MRDFFEELFAYTHHHNTQFIQLLLKNPEKASEKIVSLMSHTLNAHGNWNARILYQTAPYSVWEVRPNESLLTMEKNNYQNSLEILRSRDLNEVISFTLSNGQALENTVRNMLFQAINHATYHRAQMNTEWKLNGVAPLQADYIFFKH